MRWFPPFELDAESATFAALDSRISGLVFGGEHGTNWLRDVDGNVYLIHINQRDLEFKFEVFSLAISTMSGLAEQVANWVPRNPPPDLHALFRDTIQRRPEAPIPPSHFDPWPFEQWRVEVLRRTEFILEDADFQGAVGEAPTMQSAARPGEVPATACASCEIAVALLFTGQGGSQLLIGADWMPFNTIVTRDPAEIEAFQQSCEAIGLDQYLGRIGLVSEAP